MAVTIRFEYLVGDPDRSAFQLKLSGNRFGPDGVELRYDLHRLKILPPPSFLSVGLDLRFDTKVRSLVVAQWLLSRLDTRCDGLLHFGIDYRFRPDELARIIDMWTTGLPDGTPSDPPPDPPRDDDGGTPIGARVKRKPPGLSGQRAPEKPES